MIKHQHNFSHALAEATLPHASLSGKFTVHALQVACREVESRFERVADAAPLARSFVEKLVSQNVAGHTIFGDKPCTIIPLLTSYSDHPNLILPTLSEFYSWQRVLERTNLVSSNYIAGLSSPFGQGDERREVLLYNRRAIAQTFELHTDLFQKRFGSDCTKEDLLSRFERANTLNEIFGDDHTLLGLMLGVSRGSASAYARQQELRGLLGLNNNSTEQDFELLCLRSRGLCENEKDEYRRSLKELVLSRWSMPRVGEADRRDTIIFKVLKTDSEAVAFSERYTANQDLFRELSRLGLLVSATFARWGNLL